MGIRFLRGLSARSFGSRIVAERDGNSANDLSWPGLGARHWSLSFHSEALSFHFDDAALGFYLAADFLGGLEVGDVYGVGALVLELAAADVRAILERAARGGSPPEWAEITEQLDRIERAVSAGLPHDDQKTALNPGSGHGASSPRRSEIQERA
jgi:hypothetical protein